MSRENVEIVQAVYQAVNRHDVETILGLTAPDIEIVSGLLPDQRTLLGHEGVKAYRESLREVWGDSFHIHSEEFIEHGDRVVVVVRVRATGLASGLAVERPIAHVWKLHGGKVARLETFATRRQALEAVGLWE